MRPPRCGGDTPIGSWHGPQTLLASITVRERSPRWERLDREHANLQAAFENLVELGDDDAAARLALALWWFWINRDQWQEARTSPERLLDKAELNIGASRH